MLVRVRLVRRKPRQRVDAVFHLRAFSKAHSSSERVVRAHSPELELLAQGLEPKDRIVENTHRLDNGRTHATCATGPVGSESDESCAWLCQVRSGQVSLLKVRSDSARPLPVVGLNGNREGDCTRMARKSPFGPGVRATLRATAAKERPN